MAVGVSRSSRAAVGYHVGIDPIRVLVALGRGLALALGVHALLVGLGLLALGDRRLLLCLGLAGLGAGAADLGFLAVVVSLAAALLVADLLALAAADDGRDQDDHDNDGDNDQNYLHDGLPLLG